MAGFLAYMAAGAAQGVGASMIEEAKARREERLSELQNNRLVDREREGRQFSAAENEKSRAFTSEQNRITRESGGDAITLEDGTIGIRQGTSLKPLTGPDGKPVKGVAKSAGDAPADVQTAEWLVQKGVAKNPAEAFRMVREARSDPEKSRTAIFNKWVDALTKNSYSVDGDKVRAEAERLTNETLTFLDQGEGGGAPAAGGGAPAAANAPAASAPTAGKGGRFPDAPRDKAARKVGQVYMAPDGRKVRWKGEGWEPVQ